MHEVPSGEWTSQWSPWDEDGQSSSPKLRELKSEASATEGFCYIPDYIPTKALENFHCTIRGPCITRGHFFQPRRDFFSLRVMTWSGPNIFDVSCKTSDLFRYIKHNMSLHWVERLELEFAAYLHEGKDVGPMWSQTWIIGENHFLGRPFGLEYIRNEISNRCEVSNSPFLQVMIRTIPHSIPVSPVSPTRSSLEDSTSAEIDVHLR